MAAPLPAPFPPPAIAPPAAPTAAPTTAPIAASLTTSLVLSVSPTCADAYRLHPSTTSCVAIAGATVVGDHARSVSCSQVPGDHPAKRFFVHEALLLQLPEDVAPFLAAVPLRRNLLEAERPRGGPHHRRLRLIERGSHLLIAERKPLVRARRVRRDALRLGLDVGRRKDREDAHDRQTFDRESLPHTVERTAAPMPDLSKNGKVEFLG